MRFFNQMGHGMMSMNKELLNNFNDGLNSGVIIWPRTLEQDQIERHAKEIRRMGASVLFDSCFYMPYTTRWKITNLPYWDGIDFNTIDFSGNGGIDFCRHVIDYQVNSLNVTDILIPGRYTNVRNDDWLQMHASFAEAASDMGLDIPIYSTIALGPDLICDSASFDAVINEIVNYPVNGVYFVYHSPFLYRNDLFFLNLLTGFLSLSLSDKKIILGYANQQDLIFATAGVDTIATGNFRNVRSFDPENFEEQDDNMQQRATWYYDGSSLCEFRLPQLGLAYQRLGMKGLFGPETQYSKTMLQSSNPAMVRWAEPNSFKHYITVLRDQWLSLETIATSERNIPFEIFLEQVYQKIALYETSGMQIVDRAADTASALSAWMSALGSFRTIEGARLELLN